ncbi:MAG: DUF86 domain-containing protein [Candidatus Tectomicrobia bacterium]|uniref:DUF86 domain-containing protein n=1 Tax=Tectimicrobiota bacterium TaxID=2528274 RepID=A0A938B4M0_UNCTE|nr:DUF86 domain-containing protein [Candidatus Tectomicrobia bacterium]
MKEDVVYLRHMLECIRRIEVNSVGGRAQFMGSHTLQDAVLRNLQTLAESTQRLSPALTDTHPAIPWRRIAAFRNVLVHNYLGIDLETIWDILQHDVPPLKRVVVMMLEREA